MKGSLIDAVRILDALEYSGKSSLAPAALSTGEVVKLGEEKKTMKRAKQFDTPGQTKERKKGSNLDLFFSF